MRRLVLTVSLALTTMVGASAFAADAPPAQHASTAQPVQHEAVQVVDAFMVALANGRLEAARQYMAPDAVVMSNGQVLGDRDGYIDGAAKADAEALRNTQREVLQRGANVGADMGWVMSEKRVRSGAGAQARDLVLTETMLLVKTPAGWKITHIHWSGHAAG